MTTMKAYLLPSVAVLLPLAIFAGAVSAQDAPMPVPTGVAAHNGNAIGEAIVSWDAVPGAAFYRIGWVALPDYQATVADGREWLEAFHFLDAANTGQTQWTLSRLAPGIQYLFTVASNDARKSNPQYGNWSELITLIPKPAPEPVCPADDYLPIQSIGEFSGHGSQASTVLRLEAGLYQAIGSHNGEYNFVVWLERVPDVVSSWQQHDHLFHEGGAVADTEKTFNINNDWMLPGHYVLGVNADGAWKVSITKYGNAD